jgi:hypothetical protein
MQGERVPVYRADNWMTELAQRQHGVIALWQLVDAGMTRGWIDLRLARRRLHPVHRGVYAVGHPVLTQEGRWMAAVLACGRDAVLSHRSAAAHWRLLPASASAWTHVTIAGRRGLRRRTGMIIHRPAASVDATVHDGIPVTTVEQTLLDLAATVDRHTAKQAVGAAERVGLWLPDRAVPAGRNGAPLLRELAGTGTAPTRSALEARFLVLCEEHGIEVPEVNQWLAGCEVDFVWRARRVVVETDGGETHDGRVAFERDREKDARLTLAGFRVQRFAWRQVMEDGERTAAVVRRLLAG